MPAPALLADTRAAFPIWCLRPGSIPALGPAARAMALWMLIRSSNGREMTPCSLAEASLAAALGFQNRRPVQTRLEQLRGVPGLLFEAQCGRSRKTGRRRPHARWSTDPTRRDYWFSVISMQRLPRIAEEYGLNQAWLMEQQNRLAMHALAAADLAEEIIAECLDSPSTVSVQDAGGGGTGTGSFRCEAVKRPRKKRARRRSRR